MKITETICYKEADGIELLADLCLPEAAGPRPLLLYLHGGGWYAGKRTELQWFSGWTDTLLAAGVAVASIEYRFCTEGRSYRALRSQSPRQDRVLSHQQIPFS
jgi:acetyl esterase/lipase